MSNSYYKCVSRDHSTQIFRDGDILRIDIFDKDHTLFGTTLTDADQIPVYKGLSDVMIFNQFDDIMVYNGFDAFRNLLFAPRYVDMEYWTDVNQFPSLKGIKQIDYTLRSINSQGNEMRISKSIDTSNKMVKYGNIVHTTDTENKRLRFTIMIQNKEEDRNEARMEKNGITK